MTRVNGTTDGVHGVYKHESKNPSRADETEALLQAVLAQLHGYLRAADDEREAHRTHTPHATALVASHRPDALLALLQAGGIRDGDDSGGDSGGGREVKGNVDVDGENENDNEHGTLTLPSQPGGPTRLLASLRSILKYSVNTSCPGFLDKLYAAPLAPGIAADLVLAALNTNVHVFETSPALTLLETHVTRALAGRFGLEGARAGGFSVQGGSASNTTALVIARNTLYPRTVRDGTTGGDGGDRNGDRNQLVLFTSAHGHYSIEKAAVQCGFGRARVVSVPVDDDTGAMRPDELERAVLCARSAGKTPLFVNATAGTTVMGSFDPFDAVADVCRRHGLWMHVDAAWGGGLVFSDTLRAERLRGIARADSIAFNPHKMLGVPLTCSFLLLADLRKAERANTLRAGYLFHESVESDDSESESEIETEVEIETGIERDGEHKAGFEVNGQNGNPQDHDNSDDDDWTPPTDLADLTLQCGRRGDALKLFLSWQYYGTAGYGEKVDNAYAIARHLADLVAAHDDLVLVSQNPPPCLQVCFYYAPGRTMVYTPITGSVNVTGAAGTRTNTNTKKLAQTARRNTRVTSRIAARLVARGFMVDFAPALEHEAWKGSFFRVVVNISSVRETVERLVRDVAECGAVVVRELKEKKGPAGRGH